jgi:flagellar biosynthesis protein FlhA
MKLLNHVVSLFVILIIALIIIPLPASLLDMMFIINISLSLVILLLTMYIKQALDFSVFPSILLITTLFRLALNISSTRLILSHSGEAGQVIKTFGSFVLQGNIVVGFVVFLIIVLVQFLVITKGAERISEVAARFRLDAMPGKQMAIDADLNSGLIDEQTARKRREDIQREAEFYGSMDGASKFVKGDAIMSIVITFINFIGGLLVGMVQGGKSFGEVLNIYSIATVGDGLVSQVPALLISTATGMIVTRAASNSTLGADVSRQFSSQSMVILLAGCGIFALNLIPGMPHPQLILFSAFLIGSGLMLRRKLEQSDVPATQTAGAAALKLLKRTKLPITKILIIFMSSFLWIRLKWNLATVSFHWWMNQAEAALLSAWCLSANNLPWRWEWLCQVCVSGTMGCLTRTNMSSKLKEKKLPAERSLWIIFLHWIPATLRVKLTVSTP